MRELICLICKKKTIWQGNPFRPFCSKRCKMVDLGHWLLEAYTIEENSETIKYELPTDIDVVEGLPDKENLI